MSKNANISHSKYPPMSGKKIAKILCNHFEFDIVNNDGSHYTLQNKNHLHCSRLQVPMHNELKRGTLSHIIANAHITREEFLQAIR
jgi:predicted RNA binding protein YcfA (HicA-like mRNA interferase family)